MSDNYVAENEQQTETMHSSAASESSNQDNMPENMINELEHAVTRLIEQNRELKAEVLELREQYENLQLEQLEKEDTYAQQRSRIQQLLGQLNDL